MKNVLYTICIDKETGGIFHNSDKVGWMLPPQAFGALSYCRNVKYFGLTADFQLNKIEENENHATAYYENGRKSA